MAIQLFPYSMTRGWIRISQLLWQCTTCVHLT